VGEEAGAQLERARAAGVTDLLLAGVDPAGWRDEVALAARFPGLRLSYGVHPQVVAAAGEAACEMVDDLGRALDGELPRPAALGETGLDGTDRCVASLPLQERLFRRQLVLARRHRLPLVLHVLKAHPRALEVLAEEGLPERGAVLHSCSASADLVKRYLSMGVSISFAGAVTNPGARRIRAAAAIVPRERLLIETDAPDQTPEGQRPAPNEPAFLVEIVRALAQIRGETEAEVAAATHDNARRIFDEV